MFVRNNESVDSKFPENKILKTLSPKFNIGPKNKKGTEISFSPIMVIFCGKTYHGIKCMRTTSFPLIKGEVYKPGITETKVFYNYEEMEAYLALYEMKMPEEKRYYWQTDRNSANVQAFLGAQGTSELYEYCVANRFVTLTYSEDVYTNAGARNNYQYWTANGPLAAAQFYKVFDPFMAYQELDMFISGTLPASTAMPIEIEDKYRIAGHGFDKMSFRKAKEK